MYGNRNIGLTGFGTKRKPNFILQGAFGALPMKNGFIGKRQKALQVPGKERKELDQHSPALQVNPRQMLLTALWGSGERNWAQRPLPTPASYSGCCLHHWHKLSKVSNPNGPQTESSAFCGSLLQELLAWAMMAPSSVVRVQ